MKLLSLRTTHWERHHFSPNRATIDPVRGLGALSGTPTGGLRTPCSSVIKLPPTPQNAHTHTTSFHPAERGSRQLVRQACRGGGVVLGIRAGGMLIEAVRGCVCSHLGLLQLRVHRLILSVSPSQRTKTLTHTFVSYPKGILPWKMGVQLPIDFFLLLLQRTS